MLNMRTEYDVALTLLPSYLPATPSLLCAALACVAFAFWLFPGGLAWSLTKSRAPTPIPGPSGYPLAGSAHVFTGPTPHRALAKRARRFDASRLMAFSVGLTRFVISSHPETAREILGSPAFADRPVKESAYGLMFHRAMGFAPYGEYWRSLRRISAAHLFGPKRVAGSEGTRREIGIDMVAVVKARMARRGEVEVRKVLRSGSLNNVMTTVFGRSYDLYDGAEGSELEKMVSQGYELLGTFNWSDHLPLLGWLDLQGVNKRCKTLSSKVDLFVRNIIQEHRTKRLKDAVSSHRKDDDDSTARDFVDILLDLEKEEKLSDSDMIAVLWEMIFRGTDTVAILLEWILARMVVHPEIQEKAQAQIDAVVGFGRSVSDSDIPSLPYVQHIVKEALRVHPPGPLLSWARLAVHDVCVGDSLVPAGTTAVVNMWAITRDERLWPEPEEFRPERFAVDDVSVMGGDLRLAPFGSGRRVCPGKAMGMATVHLWLAQLLQSFRWVAGSDGGGVSFSERLKLSLEMERPLVCRAVPRVA